MGNLKYALANPKTTWAGIITAAIAWGEVVLATIDDKVETVPDFNLAVGLTIAAIGLLFSRDADKSSQDTGIRQ
jgi:hypothetical protein